MTKNLNAYYEDIIDELARDEVDRYLDYVKEKPTTLILDNLVVDVEQLRHYAPCSTCGPHVKNRMFCCGDLILDLSPIEIEKIREIHPELMKRYPQYSEVYKKKGDFFAYDDTFQRIVHKKKDETCIFFQSAGKGGMCIIHNYALSQGLDYTEYKPMVCCLYPIMVYVIEDEILIGLIGEESRVVMDMPDEGKCCAQKKGKPESNILVQGEKILTEMFGKKKYQSMRKAVLLE